MIKGVYAVQIKTRNLDALRKFYSKTLGLLVNHSCAGCSVLEIQGGGWLTIQSNAQAAQDLAETSPVSMAFAVDDVAALYKKATAEGAKWTSAPQDESWGAVSAALLDPDGNKVILIQEKPEAAKGHRCCAKREEPREGALAPNANPAAKAPSSKPKGKAKA